MTLASIVSKAALVFAVLFMIGANQSSGAILDTRQGSMGMFGISYDQCQAIGAAIKKKGEAEAYYLTALLVIARVEATLFLGLGAGAVYALRPPQGARGQARGGSLDARGEGPQRLPRPRGWRRTPVLPLGSRARSQRADVLLREDPNRRHPSKSFQAVLNWSAFALSASAAAKAKTGELFANSMSDNTHTDQPRRRSCRAARALPASTLELRQLRQLEALGQLRQAEVLRQLELRHLERRRRLGGRLALLRRRVVAVLPRELELVGDANALTATA